MKKIVSVAVIAAIAISVSAAPDGVKRFEFDEDGTFTFLMISDWHRRTGKSDTAREVALFRNAVARFRPSLVVFGGDNVSGGTGCSRRGVFEELMTPVMAEFKASGTSLCVAFGNHDSEPPESDKAFLSRQEQYDWYKSSLGDLFVDHDVPELTGVGTGVVPVFARGASKPSFKIFVADSGDHPKRDANGKLIKKLGVDNPHSDQIAWYLRESSDGVPHIWIQHIIVPDANCNGLFVPAGDGEGQKNFLMPDGSKRRMKLASGVAGVCKEKTCPPTWKTYRDAEHTVDSMTLYDAWCKSGCMKGAFFGHDHTNTFDGMDKNGIRIGMTRSINCGGSYNDGNLGFRVFKISKDGTFESWTETESTFRADGRIAAAWESRRGEPYVEVPVSPPVFHGHPRFAQLYSRAIIHFALRVFHNAETNEYALANRKIAENCRFYIENKDVRNDRDSFYWNVGELCRIVLHYGSKGDIAPGLLSPEAEAAFLEMAFGYCHDMSRLSDAAADGMKTWRVYESENHHVQRNSALWQLMHTLLKVDPAYGERKLARGGTLREHYDAWENFFCAWMRERAKRSMFIEVQSRVYGIHTMKNVYPLYDFSERPETRRLAKNFIDLFWALWAEEQIDGASGGGMSRVYPSVAVKTATEASGWAYWYFGLNPSLAHKPDGMDYVCLDSAYRPHPLIGRIAADAKARGVYEIEMRPLGWTLPSNKYPNYRPDPEWGRIYRYTYATPDFIVGTQMYPQAPGDKWCLISSQNRFHGVVFGPRDAEILPIPAVKGRHSKTAKLPSVGYNSFWSMQRKGTLLTRRNRHARATGGMRVFFSAAGGVDKVERDGAWWFTKCGGAYSAVRVASGEARLVEAGKDTEILFDAKGKFLVCADEWSPVIVETARTCDFADEAAFRAKVKATALVITPSALDYTGIYGNRFHMLLERDDGSTIDGEPYVRKIDWSIRSPFIKMPWLGDAAEISFGGEAARLDFGVRHGVTDSGTTSE